MTLQRNLLLSTLALVALLSGCVEGGVHHGMIMRGQVLDLENGVATVCVGTQDGAKVGQVLDVYRFSSRVNSGSPKGGVTYSRSDAGRVKITDLFDEHYAHAQVLTGNPTVNDVVELRVQ